MTFDQSADLMLTCIQTVATLGGLFLTWKALSLAVHIYETSITGSPKKPKHSQQKIIGEFLRFLAGAALCVMTIVGIAYLRSSNPPSSVTPPAAQAGTPPAPSQSGLQFSSVAGETFVTVAGGTIVRATPEPGGTRLGELGENATVTATKNDQGDPGWLHIQGDDTADAFVTGYVNRQEVVPQ